MSRGCDSPICLNLKYYHHVFCYCLSAVLKCYINKENFTWHTNIRLLTVRGICTHWFNALRSCSPRTKAALFQPEIERTPCPPASHLCISSPNPSLARTCSCGWPTTALWSSSPDWAGPRQQTCTSLVLARPKPARRQTAPRTRTARRCSPPEQSVQSGRGQPVGPCRKGGSPWARTSASDRRSWSRPEKISTACCCSDIFLAQDTQWNKRVTGSCSVLLKLAAAKTKSGSSSF